MSNSPFDRNKVREPKLGHLITEDGPEIRRDAVHIAVIPMIAETDLYAGDSVALTPDCKKAFRRSRVNRSWNNENQEVTEVPQEGAVGIVDPFLLGSVPAGSRFWLFIFPGQVTTLQHAWTHPAFPDSEQARPPAGSKAESEAWLRAYAIRFYDYSTPEEGYRKLLEQMVSGTICYEGTDMHDRCDLVDADELRRHTEIVLGRRINYDDFEYFSCTC